MFSSSEGSIPSEPGNDQNELTFLNNSIFLVSTYEKERFLSEAQCEDFVSKPVQTHQSEDPQSAASTQPDSPAGQFILPV